MDLSKRIDAEQLFELELLDPVTEEPLGIKAGIRSAGSEEAKKVLRRHTDKMLERRIKNKQVTSVLMEAQDLEQVASTIASWDWGKHDWGGKKPDMTDIKQAVKVLDEGGWIYLQVKEASQKIENFSSNLEEPSQKQPA